jgi:hypothetical protein
MNRPTKYRAWANGKMREVRAISFTETGEVHRILDSEGVQRVPEALLQFTGLTDKDGTEIYEGDVFQDEEDSSCEHVEWDDEFGGWSTQAWYSVGEFAQIAKSLEVIGTIYENPELLAK